MGFDITSKLTVAMQAVGGEGVRTQLASVGREVDRVTGLADSLSRAYSGLIGGLAAGALVGMVKGSIDAAEALHDLSIQTGMTVERLSAMVEVGRGTGTAADEIAKATNRLARGMAAVAGEGDPAARALKAIGIDFKAFRDLHPDEQMVTLAKAMANFEDGSGKSAVAMELMGREGAKLLPFMKDLAAANELAATTTAEQAAMADQFNDAIAAAGGAVQGLQRQLALGLLPSLIEVLNISGEFAAVLGQQVRPEADAAGQSFGGLGTAATLVGTVLEALIVTGANVAYVVRGIGTEIGGIIAQAEAFWTFDWGSIGKIRELMVSDAEAAREKLVAFEKSILGITARANDAARVTQMFGVSTAQAAADMELFTGATTRAAAGKIKYTAAAGAAAKATKQHGDAMDEAVEAYRRSEFAGRKGLQAMEERNAIVEREIELGRDLTEGEKQLVELTKRLADGTWALSDAQRDAYKASSAAGDALRKERDYLRETAAANQKAFDALVAKTDAVEAELAAQERANEVAGLSADAMRQLEVARLRDAAAAARRQAAVVGTLDFEGKITGEYLAQAEALERLADSKQRGIHIQSAIDSAAEWKRTTDSIESGLTDALMRAFESGKGFADAFKSTIVNAFKTMVLEPAVRGIVGAGGNYIGGALGLSGGGAGRSGGGWAGNAMSAYGAIDTLASGSAIGSALFGNSAAYGAAIGTTSVGAGSQAAMLAAQTGEFGWAGLSATYGAASGAGAGGAAAGAAAGAGSGGMSALAVTGWVAVVVAVLYAIFGDHSKWSMGSVAERKFEPDGSLARTRFDLPYQFGNNTEHQRDDKATAAIADQIGGSVASALQTFGGSASGLGFSVRTDADREGEAAAIISILRGGQVLGGTQTGSGAFGSVLPEVAATKINADQLDEWFGTALPQIIVQALQQSDLEDRFEDYFDSVAAGADLTSEKASELLQTASAVKQLSEAFTPLGGVFTQLSTLAVSTVADFAKAAGGFDSLAAATQAYYQTFYTEAERTEITTAGLQRAFADVGLVLPDVSAGAEAARLALRAMVDSQELETEAGRRAAAVMLQTSGAIGALIESALRAEEEAAQRTAQIADKRTALEIELLRAQGNELGAVARERELELAALRALDPALVGLQQSIWDTIETTEAAADAAARIADAAKLLTTRPDNRLTTRSQIDTAAAAILESIDMGELMSRVDITKAPQRWLDHLASGDAGWDEAFVRQSLAINQRVSEMVFARSSVVSGEEARAMAQLQYSGQAGTVTQQDTAKSQLAETQRLIESLNGVSESLDAWRDSLYLSEMSVLSPEQQYLRAKSEFDAMVAQALAGDTAAAGLVDDRGNDVVRLSRARNGSGVGYVQDFTAVVDAVDRVAERLVALESHAAAQVKVSQAYGAQTVESLADGNRIAERASVHAMFERQANV